MKLYFRYKGRYFASVLLLSLLLLTSGGAPALAQNSYNADTNLLLTTPNITLTILSGSGFDTLIVHPSSFTVTVVAGERFTVRSTTLAILNNNGSLNPTCSSSYSELIINGPKTITVTPDGSGTCTGTTPVPAPTPASTPSGGGGGGPVTPTPTPTTPTPTPQPQAPVATPRVKATPLPNLILGTLLKLPCPTGKVDVNHACKAVYYYGSDGKRRPFPNDKAYFTWYKDFSVVKEVSLEVMSKIALSKAVTYKPGAKMVKFQTLNKVYAVSSDGQLRWVQTEELARNFYGSDWNKKIDDVSDAFYTNYSFGADIKTKTDYSPNTESSTVSTIDKDMGF